MRYLTLRIVSRDSDGFHPLGRRLAEEPSLKREAVHHFERLDDGTVLLLAEGSGDRDRYEGSSMPSWRYWDSHSRRASSSRSPRCVSV